MGCYQPKTGFEYQLFKNFCNELIEADNKYDTKEILNSSIRLLTDPISLVHTIDTIGILNIKITNILKKNSKDELIEILKIGSAPFLPLSKSVIIIDTIGFFSENYNYNNSEYSFIISKVAKLESHTNNDVFYLYKSGCRNNELILSFLFQERKYILNCNYKVGNIIDMPTRLYYFENNPPH